MASNKIAKKQTTWHYNAIGQFAILLLIFAILSTCVIIKDSLIQKQITNIKKSWYEYSKKFNLSLNDIIIEGRQNVTKQEINNLLELNRNTSFLGIKEEEIKQRIKQLAWIKDAEIKKTYLPNVLQVKLEEKKVIALLQEKDKFFPLDGNAQIIKTTFVPKKEYIIVSGQGASKNLLKILNTTSKNEEVFKRIKAFQYISNRRWNIILDNIKEGKTIKLPENNFDAAWKKLIKINQTRGLLKRPLTIIDLRFDDKIIIKLKKETKEIKT